MALTDKQAAFVREYLVDLNASAAARRAGYSESTAGIIGHENLQKPKIAAEIEKAQAERAESTRVTAEWVVKRLQEEADYRGEGASHSARIKALELLGKHTGVDFTDKVEHSGGVNVNVEGAARELADRIARLANASRTDIG